MAFMARNVGTTISSMARRESSSVITGAVECALVVLGRGERDRALAVAQREERRLLAGQTFLDDDLGAGRAEPAGQHHVDGGLRLLDALRHHYALAGGKTVGLHHDRRAFLA